MVVDMSWRNGSRLFIECWPLITKHVSEPSVRDEFVKQLVKLFESFDMDSHDLHGVAPDLDEILGVESNNSTPGADIKSCIAGLSGADEVARNNSAQAVIYFVGVANGLYAQEAADALVSAAINDDSLEIRIVALKSLRELIDEYAVAVVPESIVGLTVAGDAQISEQAEYVLRAIQRKSQN